MRDLSSRLNTIIIEKNKDLSRRKKKNRCPCPEAQFCPADRATNNFEQTAEGIGRHFFCTRSKNIFPHKAHEISVGDWDPASRHSLILPLFDALKIGRKKKNEDFFLLSFLIFQPSSFLQGSLFSPILSLSLSFWGSK